MSSTTRDRIWFDSKETLYERIDEYFRMEPTVKYVDVEYIPVILHTKGKCISGSSLRGLFTRDSPHDIRLAISTYNAKIGYSQHGLSEYKICIDRPTRSYFNWYVF